MNACHARSAFFAVLLAGSSLASLAALAQPAASDALISAVQDGMAAQVDALLAKHVDVNATDGTGATALSWAVVRGTPELAARLLKAGANPNLSDANGVSPLMLAIDNNLPDIVALLLANGADPNLARPDGETPLMHAVDSGSVPVVEALVARKADVNAHENRFAQTALMWAAGHPDITRILLANGADIQAVTKSWETTTTNYSGSVSTLGVTGIPWNFDGEYTNKAGGLTALHFAVQEGDSDSVKQLLQAGIEVDRPSADGTTPLLTSLYNWRAARGEGPRRNASGGVRYSANFEMANLLLDAGAKPNVTDRAGYTPLHGAVLSLLMSGGARGGGGGGGPFIGFNPTKRSAPDAPPPTVPANEDAVLVVVKRLLDLGANPNQPTENTTPGPLGAIKVNPASPGSTPFHIAAAAHSAKLTDMMAAHGANPNQTRKDGHTPFTVAVMSNDLPVVQSLVNHGADLQMIYNPADKIADPVLSKAEARKNETILHMAAIAGANYVVGLLAKKGAPVTVKNDHGETPLDLADAQEQFRFAHDKEGALGIGLSNVKKETQTSDAIKRVLGIKAKVASN